MRGRTVGLDFARGVAILLVMGYHFKVVWTTSPLWSAVETPFKSFGATGVDLFFLLSGFLVGGLLLSEYQETGRVRVKRFLVRRALKILPAYYVYILLQIVSRHFPLHTFVWQNLLQIQNYVGTSISHTWTVSLEIHFYLLLVGTMAVLARRKAEPKQIAGTFLVFIALAIIVRSIAIYGGHGGTVLFYTHNRLDTLCCGVLLAILSIFYPLAFEKLCRRPWPLALVTMVFVVYLFRIYPATMEVPRPGWGYFGIPILTVGYASFMLLLLRHSGGIGASAPYRAVAWVGTHSYSIYLWHNSVRTPCYWVASFLPVSLRWPMLFVGQYAAAIALGAAMTNLVEWPFLRIRDRLVPRPDVMTITAMAEPLTLTHGETLHVARMERDPEETVARVG